MLTITEQSSGQVYGKINNPPANWTFKPTSPLKEGYHTLLFTVEDAAGNEGSTSRVALSFTVDDTAPEGKRFQIRRPNYTFTDFKDYDYLKNLEYTYINMDYFQNGEFSIVGEFEDDIGVSEIKFSIFDREDLQNPVLVKTVKAGIEDKNSEFYVDNINTPVVTVKSSDLIAKNAKYADTKSFLYITCISFDEHGNVNSEPFKLGYLIWDPDSDKPQFKPTGFTLDDDGNLKVPASTAIKFDIFDDDGIREVYYKIYQENDTLPNLNTDIIDDANKKFEPADYPLLITTNDYTSAASYTTNYLVWTVIDKSGKVSNSGRIKITIDDQKIPTVTIVSPEKNIIPAFDSALKTEGGSIVADYVKFSIKGYGVDTNSCVSIKMAYLKPGYTATMDVIKSNFSSVTEVSNEFTQFGDAYYKVGTLLLADQANGGNKYNFTFDIDLTNDKDTNGNKVFDYTSNKTFVFELIDNDNNNGKSESEINDLLKDPNKIYSAYPSNEGLITPKTPTDKNISVADIRSVLEVAGYHKRTLDVTSSLVTVQDKIATVEFPAGLTGEGNLPLGREWELVIEEGAFLDMAGNSFGEDNQDSKAEVKIKTNNSEFFYSAGVATPVIRVDRYSYGLGIKQSDNSGNLTEHIKNDKVEPTGYVRVRIDCETKDAKIKYQVNGDTRNNKSESTVRTINGDTEQTTSYISSTSVTKPSEQEIKNVSGQNSSGVVFAVGSGSYKESYKGIIGAVASKDFNNSDVSAIGTEGVFQTVVQFVNPLTGTKSEASQGANKTDWSIRGTTSQGNEPSISPFPLRDSLNGSPYLRITYRTDNVDYYWVSYEILVESSFSGHGWARAWRYFYNWAKNWGIMEPGEYTRVTNMKNWE